MFPLCSSNPQIQNSILPRNENVIRNIEVAEEIQNVMPTSYPEQKTVTVVVSLILQLYFHLWY